MWNKKNCFTRKKKSNDFILLFLLPTYLQFYIKISAGECMTKEKKNNRKCGNVHRWLWSLYQRALQCAEQTRFVLSMFFGKWQSTVIPVFGGECLLTSELENVLNLNSNFVGHRKGNIFFSSVFFLQI